MVIFHEFPLLKDCLNKILKKILKQGKTFNYIPGNVEKLILKVNLH